MATTSRASIWTLPSSVALPATAVTLTALFIAAGAPAPLLVYYQRELGFPSALLALAFGIYALGLLAALLTVGSLSDYLGRRPVVIGAIVLELGALVLFLFAGDVQQLISARLIQGVATGAVTTALTAWMIELAPPRLARVTNIVGSVAPAGGLGLGALLAGLVTAVAPEPTTIVWGALIVLLVLGVGAAAGTPETKARMSGAKQSLVPHLRVPPSARQTVPRVLPVLISAWLLAALFIGLMPTILTTLFEINSLFTDGSVIFVEPAAACVAAVVLTRANAARVLHTAALLIAAGSALVLAGILTAVLPLLLIGGAIAGSGFGAANSGIFRVLLPRAEADARSALVTVIYVAAYVAFGVPAIVAGLLVPLIGLQWVAIGFATLVILTSGLGLVASADTRSRRPNTF